MFSVFRTWLVFRSLGQSAALLCLAVAGLALGPAHAAKPAQKGLSIRPYLTALDAQSATLNWRLKSPSRSTLTYAATLNFRGARKLKSKRVGVQHHLNLSGLNPDTVYHFRIDNIYQGWFKTLDPAKALEFVVVGHTHGTESMEHYPDRLLADRVLALEPDFLIHTGDATYFNRADDYRRFFFRDYERLLERAPVYIAPGNHDAGWPFVYGTRVNDFKELFPYRYANRDSATQFHEMRQGDLLFLFLAYTSDIGPGSAQRTWISERLSQSDAKFNILVLGGAQPAYYDRSSFLAFLETVPVDLVLMGDGFQPEQPLSYAGQVPIYFVGTGGGRPHPLLYGQSEKDYLRLVELDATGTKKRVFWLFDKRPRTAKLDLLPTLIETRFENRTLSMVFQFEPAWASNAIEGVQVAFDLDGNRNAGMHVLVRPNDMDSRSLPPRNEGGFRTNHYDIRPGDHLVSFTVEKLNPFTGRPFLFNRVKLNITGLDAESDILLRGIHLF